MNTKIKVINLEKDPFPTEEELKENCTLDPYLIRRHEVDGGLLVYYAEGEDEPWALFLNLGEYAGSDDDPSEEFDTYQELKDFFTAPEPTFESNPPPFPNRTIVDAEAATYYLKCHRISHGQYTEDTKHAIQDYEALAKRLDEGGYPHPHDIVWVMGVPCLYWTDPNFKWHVWFENYNEDDAGD